MSGSDDLMKMIRRNKLLGISAAERFDTFIDLDQILAGGYEIRLLRFEGNRCEVTTSTAGCKIRQQPNP
jgi:hypothetical protein